MKSVLLPYSCVSGTGEASIFAKNIHLHTCGNRALRKENAKEREPRYPGNGHSEEGKWIVERDEAVGKDGAGGDELVQTTNNEFSDERKPKRFGKVNRPLTSVSIAAGDAKDV
ncbi:hypothetical protein NDU88_007323 [Pleurodeles waltl]|uniref:Uncharacterized protein n=1 Tax=Pleurodeles waltl TaxID=8319 RepID=A0AAV7U044_PLEWA|nr:hypothetical protein NDU88_007323 [Pleurodeles waltl]